MYINKTYYLIGIFTKPIFNISRFKYTWKIRELGKYLLKFHKMPIRQFISKHFDEIITSKINWQKIKCREEINLFVYLGK